MQKFFNIPFASDGDRSAVANIADPSGVVTYEEGYGPDYQRPRTDPAKRNIERDRMNQVFFDITTAVGELQSKGAPDFITSALNGGVAFPYSINAVVRYSGELYYSLANANTALPTDTTKWAVLPKNSAQLLYSPSGTGAATRFAQDKLREWITTTDYDTLAHAKTAAGNQAVYDPVGILNKDTFNNLTNVFQESGETTWFSSMVQRHIDTVGAHSGSARSAHTIEYNAKGSGANGPTNADYGLTVSALKKNFSTTSVVGELDALNIVVRQGGATSDSCAMLANVATYGTGFMGIIEGQTSIINGVGTVLQQIQSQMGICDNVNNNYVGFFANANKGTNLNAAFQANSTSGASWANVFVGQVNSVERISITGTGTIRLSDGAGGRKTLRTSSNRFAVLNAAESAELFAIVDGGAVSANADISSGTSFTVGSNKVVGQRDTGWVAFTGTGNKNTSYDTSTITLQQLAQRVNSIQVALTTHGLLGA